MGISSMRLEQKSGHQKVDAMELDQPQFLKEFGRYNEPSLSIGTELWTMHQ